jgi:hypothetical protein
MREIVKICFRFRMTQNASPSFLQQNDCIFFVSFSLLLFVHGFRPIQCLSFLYDFESLAFFFFSIQFDNEL